MGTMKNTKAAKAAPKTVKNLADLTAPVKPENPTSPIPPPDAQPEGTGQASGKGRSVFRSCHTPGDPCQEIRQPAPGGPEGRS